MFLKGDWNERNPASVVMGVTLKITRQSYLEFGVQRYEMAEG